MNANQEKRIVLDGEDVQRTISRMAHEIVEKNGRVEELSLIGIRSRGADLVRRIAQKIEALKGAAPSVAIIDVTPYRDDIASGEPLTIPKVPIAIDDKTVVLVDDVIYRGRTIRAALDLMGHLGKPKRILVAVLIDRGDRELPIKADIVGKNIQVAEPERINVLLRESDGVDQVVVSPGRRSAG
jgi:pyrimidine operon attenuation protein/uracil phosphoribosyltransferase